ncbi:MAG TPA: aminotransferase class V-fold PLP-dependent enzyme, partial [Spirochaetota bacterium]
MIYLNNAATTWPKPESVYHAVDYYTRYYGAGFGRGNDALAKQSSEVVFDCRCAIAELFGIQAVERVIFTFNATDAINIAFKGMLEKGDHVIISDMEHNAVLRPLMKMKESDMIALSIAESDAHGVMHLTEIEKHIRPNTRLIEMIHVSNVTGAVNDITRIGEMCRCHGIPLMVDASQSAGCYDINVIRDNISLLALPGHKGLYGPQGTGILYVAPDINLDTLREGGTGSGSKSFS